MQVKFIVTESFLRTNKKTDPFYDPVIRVIEARSNIDWKVFLWAKDVNCGYPAERTLDYHAFELVGIWFYKICRLFAWRVPSWKIYRFLGSLMRPIFSRKFAADIVVTQSGQFAEVFSGLLPNMRVIDIQHGVIYSHHSGYFGSDARLLPLYQAFPNREFWVYGEGYADCFFKHPCNVKDLQGRVKVIGDVIRAGEDINRAGHAERVERNYVVFSLQLTADLTREEMVASITRMEKFFDEFLKKFGGRYECFVKHHPRFNDVYDLSDFFSRFPQVKETKEQWAELYPRMVLHVTFVSTVTFDCASAGVPTYLLDFPDAKILKRDLFRDDYAYPYFDKTVEEILEIPADEATKMMEEWYGKFYAPFDEENCLRLLKNEDAGKML